ncbi:hypothetical protein PISL3812_04012 [Talaromyces islandicus]|uniref:Amidoligase enzyme n=1 Tax=Talaromyces islandicus TaxID=28573 RepID=A0A0U1LUD4_TALIS|nr:hypothetical protein PISL3812_04012 [Talaromyces islandicus]
MESAESSYSGLEVVLSDVNDIEPPQPSKLHGPTNSVEDTETEICRIYEELRSVAHLLACRWNSNVESMNASTDVHHQFAPMRSQFKGNMRIDHKWSYDKWVIGFSRSLSDEFLPMYPFEFRSPTVPYENLDILLVEIQELIGFLRHVANVSVPRNCGLHVQVSRSRSLWTINEMRMWMRSVRFFEMPLRQILPEHRRDRRLSGYPLAINYDLYDQPHPSDNQDLDWYGYLLNPKEIEALKEGVNPLSHFLTPASLQQDDQLQLGSGPAFDYIVEFRGPAGINYADECVPAVDLAVRFAHASLRQGSARQLQGYQPTIQGLYNFLKEAKIEGMAVHLDSYFGPLVDSSGP